MAKVTFHPEDGTPNKTSIMGFAFDASGAPTEVPEGKALDKFRAMQVKENPFFTVVEDGGKGGQAGAPPVLEAVHRGRGVFGIREDGVMFDLPPMTKADADAFNAMSEEDKRGFAYGEPKPQVAPALAPPPLPNPPLEAA